MLNREQNYIYAMQTDIFLRTYLFMHIHTYSSKRKIKEFKRAKIICARLLFSKFLIITIFK